MVDAQQRGWQPDRLKFEIVGDLEGARRALAKGSADVFMWEKFTTKHLVDHGEWRRVGEVRTRAHRHARVHDRTRTAVHGCGTTVRVHRARVHNRTRCTLAFGRDVPVTAYH